MVELVRTSAKLSEDPPEYWVKLKTVLKERTLGREYNYLGIKEFPAQEKEIGWVVYGKDRVNRIERVLFARIDERGELISGQVLLEYFGD